MPAAASSYLSALVLLVMLAAPLPGWAQNLRPAGAVVALVGDVQVERPGAAEVMPLSMDDPLFVGDRVVTAAASRAKLELIDGSIMQLGEKTGLELTWMLDATREGTRAGMISVGLGIVRTVVDTVIPRTWFEVRTPTAIASVRGTDWILEAQPEATPIVALDGDVAVRNVDDRFDEVVVLGPGEGTTVPLAGPPTGVARWGQARVDSFVERTNVDEP